MRGANGKKVNNGEERSDGEARAPLQTSERDGGEPQPRAQIVLGRS